MFVYCMHMYMHTITMTKEVMDLKESEEETLGGALRAKGREKCN